jgi:hypothetical protein
MKLGVYGDSFADAHHKNNHTWWNFLAEKIGASQVVTHGVGGTPLWFSYQQFLQSYHLYDQIVILVTDPPRYVKKSTTVPDKWLGNINNLLYLKEKYSKESHVIKELDLVESWFLASDETFMVTVNELMLAHMERLHENTLFFPCFGNAMTNDRKIKEGIQPDTSMMCLALDLLSKCQLTDKWYKSPYKILENPETIAGHMGPEHNEFFASVVFNKLNTGIWSFEGLADVVLEHPVHYYFTY